MGPCDRSWTPADQRIAVRRRSIEEERRRVDEQLPGERDAERRVEPAIQRAREQRAPRGPAHEAERGELPGGDGEQALVRFPRVAHVTDEPGDHEKVGERRVGDEARSPAHARIVLAPERLELRDAPALRVVRALGRLVALRERARERALELADQRRGRGHVASIEQVRDHRFGRGVEPVRRFTAFGPHAPREAEAEARFAVEVEHAQAVGVGVVAHFGRELDQLGELRAPHVGHQHGVAVAQVVLDGLLERVGARIPRSRVARHRGGADPGERGRDAVRELGILRGEPRRDLHDVLAGVRRAPGEHVKERRAEQVHVGVHPEARSAAAEHLGRHVARRSGEAPHVRDEREASRPVVEERDGDAPVDEVDLAEAADHHVVRLDVAVDDAAAVREADRVAHRHEHREVPLEHVLRAVALAHPCLVGDELGPALAFDALEHDARRAGLVEHQVVHRNDVGMLDRSEHPRFLEERLLREPRAHVLAQLLDRHRAPEGALLREVDDAHPSAAELAEPLDARARVDGSARLLQPLAGGQRRVRRRARACADGDERVVLGEQRPLGRVVDAEHVRQRQARLFAFRLVHGVSRSSSSSGCSTKG